MIKDIDIISGEEDFAVLEQRTADFLKTNVSGYEVRVLRKEDGVLYRVELNGFLMIQLDLGVGAGGLCREFWQSALERKLQIQGYYIPAVQDEICIRVNEYLSNPTKLHHLQYLKEHAEEYREDLLEKYLEYEPEKYREIKAVL